jgi:hypothetical protein
MGVHPTVPPASGSDWTTARRGPPDPPDGRRHPLCAHYGLSWQDLPREYGAPTTVWRRLKRWGETFVWESIWRAALAALDLRGHFDWTIAFLDGSFAPAKNGGEKVGLTRKGKGTK